MKAKSKGKDYIPQFTVILDCEGLGWKHYTSYDGTVTRVEMNSEVKLSYWSFFSVYSGLQAVLTMFKYFEANYPETIRQGIFVNSKYIIHLLL